jgi:hypothetical protein
MATKATRAAIIFRSDEPMFDIRVLFLMGKKAGATNQATMRAMLHEVLLLRQEVVEVRHYVHLARESLALARANLRSLPNRNDERG